MPSGSINKRVTKTNQGSQTALVKAQPHRAKPSTLAEYDEVIRYYVQTRRLTHEQLWFVMESMFKLNATPKQYSGYIERSNCKVNLNRQQWRSIYPYYAALKAQTGDGPVAVRINGSYLIQPDSVKRKILRQVLPSEQALMKRKTAQIVAEMPNQSSYNVDGIEILSFQGDAETKQMTKIPIKILNDLPIQHLKMPLLYLCQWDLQIRYNQCMDLGMVANSNYFKHLRRLLFGISNQLLSIYEIDSILDLVMAAGYRSTLKNLLLIGTPTIIITRKTLLPLLFLRGDSELLELITKDLEYSNDGLLFEILDWLHLRLHADRQRSTSLKKLETFGSKYDFCDAFTKCVRLIEKRDIKVRVFKDAINLLKCYITYRTPDRETLTQMWDREYTQYSLRRVEIVLRVFGLGSDFELSSIVYFALLEVGTDFEIFETLVSLGFGAEIPFCLFTSFLQNDDSKYSNSTFDFLLYWAMRTRQHTPSSEKRDEFLVLKDNPSGSIEKVEQFLGSILISDFSHRISRSSQNRKYYMILVQLLDSIYKVPQHFFIADLFIHILASKESVSNNARKLIYSAALTAAIRACTRSPKLPSCLNDLLFERIESLLQTSPYSALGPLECQRDESCLVYLAVECGNSKLLETLLAWGFAACEICSKANKMLYALLRQDSPKVFNMMISAGFDPSILNKVDDFRAIYGLNHLGACRPSKKILDGINRRSSEDVTKLWKSRFESLAESSETLLINTMIASLCLRDGDSWDPVLIKDLAHRSAVLEIPYCSYFDFGPCNVIQLLSEKGDIQLMKYFLENFPETRLQIAREYPETISPLAIAVSQKNLACASFLVEHGANVNEKAKSIIWPSLKSRKSLKKEFLAPLEIAAGDGSLEIVRYLIEQGAESDLYEGFSSTGLLSKPIGLAIDRGRFDVVALLLRIDPRWREGALSHARQVRSSLAEYIKDFKPDQNSDLLPSDMTMAAMTERVVCLEDRNTIK